MGRLVSETPERSRAAKRCRHGPPSFIQFLRRQPASPVADVPRHTSLSPFADVSLLFLSFFSLLASPFPSHILIPISHLFLPLSSALPCPLTSFSCKIDTSQRVGGTGDNAVVGMTQPTEQRSVERSVETIDPNAAAIRASLRFFFSDDGEFFRDFLLDEVSPSPRFDPLLIATVCLAV